MAQPSNYMIRPIDIADEPFLWEMLYHAVYVPEGSPLPPREIINSTALAKYVRNWGRANDMGFLAVHKQSRQPVGAVWLRLMTVDEAGYGHVDDETPELSIAVLPQHRGRGAGTLLLTCLLDSARNKYKSISLSVSAENPAVRLYSRFGFEIVSRKESSLTMKKEMSASPPNP